MTDDNFGFCPSCGNILTEDSIFCPSCGKPLSVSSPQEHHSSVDAYGFKRPMQGGFLIAFVLIAFYGLLSFISALTLLASPSTTADALIEVANTFGIQLSDLFNIPADWTREDVINVLITSGLIELVTSIPVIIAGVLCLKRMYFKVTVALLVVASLLTLLSGVGAIANCVIGLIVSYLVYNSKDYFEC